MLTEMSVIGLNPVAHISQLTASQQTELSANPQMNANNLLGGSMSKQIRNEYST